MCFRTVNAETRIFAMQAGFACALPLVFETSMNLEEMKGAIDALGGPRQPFLRIPVWLLDDAGKNIKENIQVKPLLTCTNL